jgi:thiol-disulfide isomerase/thioredoxin
MTRLRQIVLILFLATLSWGQTPLRIPFRPDPNLYRADINAQEEINATIAAAGKEHKRVILVFGANWCGDCHALDYAFHQPRIAPLLNSNFKVVHVDVGRYDKNLDLAKQYQVDLEKGIPSLAVLTPQGGLLYSTAQFERARLMTEEDVIQFLKAWKPAAQSAK